MRIKNKDLIAYVAGNIEFWFYYKLGMPQSEEYINRLAKRFVALNRDEVIRDFVKLSSSSNLHNSRN